MLAIVFLAINAIALHILRLMDAGAFLTGHHTIGLGAIFHVVDALLAALQAVGFALRQAAGGDALIDATLLVGLALINSRRVGLGESESRQNDGNGGNGFDGFHDFPPSVQGKLPGHN